MNRRTLLQTGYGVTALLMANPAWAAKAQKQEPTDDELLSKARARFEKHRMGAGVVAVRDSAERAVRDAKVTVEQVRHEFLTLI